MSRKEYQTTAKLTGVEKINPEIILGEICEECAEKEKEIQRLREELNGAITTVNTQEDDKHKLDVENEQLHQEIQRLRDILATVEKLSDSWRQLIGISSSAIADPVARKQADKEMDSVYADLADELDEIINRESE